MATVSGIMDPNVNWNPTDWASTDARAEIKGKATAELKRGIDLSLDAEIGVSAAGHIAKFLALDVGFGAHAAIELKAQAQILLDIFDEVGVAIRLRAEAELAAFINIGIGIKVKDFIDLARKSPLMQDNSVQMELLIAILNEAKFQGGVAAKAALCAMAYANISCTGRLVSKGEDGPGFYLVGDYGAGFEGGAGVQMFIKVGIENSRRVIGNCTDIAVDNTLNLIDKEFRKINTKDIKKSIELLWSLRAPAKIAMRTAFEMGVALSEDPNFRIKTGDVAKELAKRCVTIAIEEAQPYILELVLDWAMDQLRKVLGFKETTWIDLVKDTNSVAYLLENMPDNPFEIEDDEKLTKNLKYWSDVILGFDKLREDIDGEKSDFELYLSMVWSATQLSFIVAHYIHKKRSNNSTESPTETDYLEITPPEGILKFVLTQLKLATTSKVTISQLLQYVSTKITDRIDTFSAPESSTYTIFSILSGGEINKNTKGIVSHLINGIGTLDLKPTDLITVDRIQKGLKWYMTEIVEEKLKDVVDHNVKNELSKNMVNEVLVKSIGYTTDHIITTVRNYDSSNKTLLREACSSVVMRLISRSLVVLTDELLAYTMQQTHNALQTIGNDINSEKSDPIFNKIIKKERIIDRKHAKHIVSEMFHIFSNVFKPFDDATRKEARDLMYELLDGMPDLAQLKEDHNFPGKDQLRALALNNSKVLKHYITEFAKVVLAKLGELILHQLKELADKGKAYIDEWTQYLENEINKKLKEFEVKLEKEITDLVVKIQASIENQKNHLNTILDYVIHNKVGIKENLIIGANKYLEDKKYSWPVRKAGNIFLSSFGSTLITIILKACQELKKDINFLNQLRSSNTKEQIADMIGNKLGELVASKFQFTVLKTKIGIPKSTVQPVFKAILRKTTAILDLADNLLTLFIQHSEHISDNKRATQNKADNDKKQERVKKLQEKIPQNASINFIAPVDEDQSLKDRDGKIQIQFENLPIQLIGTDPQSVSQVLIWVNSKLISIDESQVVQDNEKVFVTLHLSAGPTIVCARFIDSIVEATPLVVFVNPTNTPDKEDRLDPWVISDKIESVDNAAKKIEGQIENAKIHVADLVKEEA